MSLLCHILLLFIIIVIWIKNTMCKWNYCSGYVFYYEYLLLVSISLCLGKYLHNSHKEYFHFRTNVAKFSSISFYKTSPWVTILKQPLQLNLFWHQNISRQKDNAATLSQITQLLPTYKCHYRRYTFAIKTIYNLESA